MFKFDDTFPMSPSKIKTSKMGRVNPGYLTFIFVAREAAIWELEERQLHEKHQLAKRQLKDLFFLKRHQMLNRHEKVTQGYTEKKCVNGAVLKIILAQGSAQNKI